MLNQKKKDPNILVVGDLMLDHYLWGSCERISPEAPVQIVDISREDTSLGGAGNVISNLISLGAKVSVASVIGDDQNATEIEKKLKHINVSLDFIVKEKGRKTSKKSRLMAAHQQIIRYDLESKHSISKQSENSLKKRVDASLKYFDGVLLSDYGKGVLTPDLTQFIIKKAQENNKFVLVDPKGDNYSKYKGATLITPNKKEASIASKINIIDEKSLLKAGMKLKNSLDLKYAIITLSEDGMAIFSDSMKKIPTIAKEVYDVTGAGDTVLSTIGVALSLGLDIYEAAALATKAAAIVVGKLGSATVTFDEIYKYEQNISFNFENKILTSLKLKKILEQKKKKVIFTNGCFDILHVGHVKYLKKAKELGEILVVGLNSDNSVKKIKGENRPINCEQDRAILLSALEFVDYVVIFNEETPYKLIKKLKPNILVKGADYKNREVVGSDLVKEVHLIEFVEGKSTTNIIKKVQKQ